MDEQGCVATVIDEEVGTLAVGPGQHLLCAPPVLLQGLTLPGKDARRVTSHRGSSMILDGKM
jgi:hypothetical protein